MSFMSDKTFIDTNVLVYAYDLEAGEKNRIANEILDRLWDERSAVLSVQVLQEFYVNITRKIRTPLIREQGRVVVSQYTRWCVGIEPSDIQSAFRVEEQYRINFWDALIVSSALKSGATRILTEDLNSGERIAGILIANPFMTTSR